MKKNKREKKELISVRADKNLVNDINEISKVCLADRTAIINEVLNYGYPIFKKERSDLYELVAKRKQSQKEKENE